MVLGERVKLRMEVCGLSQAELARRVGVSQPTIFGLINSNKIGSKHIHKIARELRTTPAYLTGETEDPDAGAPPAPTIPRLQLVMAKIALPSEAALEAAYSGLLRASRGLDEAELARELAKRLPTILRVAGDEIAFPSSDGAAAPGEAAEVPDDVRPARRRAAHS